MYSTPALPVLQREFEKWNAEVTRTAAEVADAEANLRRVGWDLASPANLVSYWRGELGKRRKAWGYAKHRLSRLITLIDEQSRYVP